MVLGDAECSVEKAGKEDREGEMGVFRVYREGLSAHVVFKQEFKGVRYTQTSGKAFWSEVLYSTWVLKCKGCMYERRIIREGRAAVNQAVKSER